MLLSTRPHAKTDRAGWRIESYVARVNVFPERGELAAATSLTVSRGRSKSLHLRLRLNCGFSVHSVSHNGDLLPYEREGAALAVNLDRTPAFEKGELCISYSGLFKAPGRNDKDAMSCVVLRADEVRLASPCGWYPRLRTDDPDGSDPPAIFSLEIIAPESFEVVASGAFKEKSPVDSGLRIRWLFESYGADVISFAAGEHARVSQVHKNTRLAALTFNQDNGHAGTILAQMADILNYYEEVFAEFPFRELAACEMRVSNRSYSYNYSVSGYMMLESRLLKRSGKGDHGPAAASVLAHEIAHQWWGNRVYPTGAGPSWVCEALSEYLSLLFVEHRYGSDVMEFYLDRIIQRCEKSLSVLAEGRSADGTPPRKASQRAPSRCPWFLHDLRGRVGLDEVLSTLKCFYAKHIGKRPGTKDFLDLVVSNYGERRVRIPHEGPSDDASYYSRIHGHGRIIGCSR
jgi:hypothetical protein